MIHASEKSELKHGSVVLNHTFGEIQESEEKHDLRPPPGMLFGPFWRPSRGQSPAKGDLREALFFSSLFGVEKELQKGRVA